MSALRLGKKPDGTRDVRIIDDGAQSRPWGRSGAIGGELVKARPAANVFVPPVQGSESPWRSWHGPKGECE